jgi:plastocyanin
MHRHRTSFIGIYLSLALAAFTTTPAFAETHTIQMAALELGGKPGEGTKIWIPSNITVKKGDTVKIHAVSKIPGKNNIHGLAIDAFKVEALVEAKGMDIEFVADKAGIFPIRCHLHPAHIGGQLVVL